MGEGRELICTSCGFRKEVWYGPGFLSGPRNPRTREDVLNGKYGKRPRQILEEHLDAECGWYRALFHCRCGNYSSKDAVYIIDGPELLYRPSRVCELCHRRMWEVQCIPYRSPCPKCGEMMVNEQMVLWD